jgi:ribose 5-phosphate isomerase B
VKVAAAFDHRGVHLRGAVLTALGTHDVVDLGVDTDAVRVDYPDKAREIGEALQTGDAARGVLVCGTGIGISIAANRHPACRCALISEPLSARLAREHNDANVIAMGGRLIGIEMAKACILAFLATPFAGGRHQRRVDKLTNPAFAKEPA